MGLQIRDERQLKVLTGWSHAEFDHLLPVFSEVYAEKQQQKYAEGVWRRMRLVPFTITIPDAEQDRQLAAKLRAVR